MTRINTGKYNKRHEAQRRVGFAWAAFDKLSYILRSNVPTYLKRKFTSSVFCWNIRMKRRLWQRHKVWQINCFNSSTNHGACKVLREP